MDETKEMLQAILHRLDSLDAKVDGLQREMNERFDKVDDSLEYLGIKWMEHDREIHQLKKKA